jgi:hypothetical protein
MARHRWLWMRGYDAEILDVVSVSWPTNTRKLTIIDPLVYESSVADTGAR